MFQYVLDEEEAAHQDEQLQQDQDGMSYDFHSSQSAPPVFTASKPFKAAREIVPALLQIELESLELKIYCQDRKCQWITSSVA